MVIPKEVKIGVCMVLATMSVISFCIWISFLVLATQKYDTTANIYSVNGQLNDTSTTIPPEYYTFSLQLVEYNFCNFTIPEIINVNCSTFIDTFQMQNLDGWGNHLNTTCNQTVFWYRRIHFTPLEIHHISDLNWLTCPDNQTVDYNTFNFYQYYTFPTQINKNPEIYFTIFWSMLIVYFIVFLLSALFAVDIYNC